MPLTEKTSAATSIKKSNDASKAANTRRIITLVVGDTLVFLVFAVLGRRSHGEPISPDALLQIVLTAAPFVIGWFIVSPLAGAYRRNLETQPRAMAIRTTLAWVLAWPVALFLRWLFSGFRDFPPLSFAIVALIFNLALLLLWRWPYALTNSMKKS